MRCIEKTLYTNGRIVTMDAAGTVAEAVLVAGNVIEAVGSKDGLAALAGPAADRRPQGRVPLPRLHRHAQPRLAVRHVENALPLSGHRAP